MVDGFIPFLTTGIRANSLCSWVGQRHDDDGSTRAVDIWVEDLHSARDPSRIAALLGGMGTLFGPVAGARLMVTLESYLAVTRLPVPIVIGAIFVVCVLLFRRSIIGKIKRLLAERTR